MGADQTNIQEGYARISNPYIITPDHRVFSNSEVDVAKEIKKLKNAGCDGFIFDYKTGDNYAIMVFNKAQVVKDISDYEVRHSDRDTDSVSNRSLLANAFEGAAQTDMEKQKIQEYRDKIDLMNGQEQKLRKLNQQIKELSFAKGKRDTAKIRELRDEATKTANRISIYDKQLLRPERSKPLQYGFKRAKRCWQETKTPPGARKTRLGGVVI